MKECMEIYYRSNTENEPTEKLWPRASSSSVNLTRRDGSWRIVLGPSEIGIKCIPNITHGGMNVGNVKGIRSGYNTFCNAVAGADDEIKIAQIK